MLRDHQLGLAYNGQPQVDWSIFSQLLDLGKRKLRRKPHAARTRARCSLQCQLVQNGQMGPHFGKHTAIVRFEKLPVVFDQDRSALLQWRPRIEADRLFASARYRIMAHGRQRENDVFGIPGLFHSRRQLARNDRFASFVVQDRHVNRRRARLPRSTRAGRIGRKSHNRGSAAPMMRQEVRLRHALERTGTIRGKELFLQVLQRTRANFMQLRKADAHPIVQLDRKLFQQKRRCAHAVDVLAHFLFVNRLRARGLHNSAFRLCPHALFGPEGNQKRATNLKPHRSGNCNLRQGRIVLEGRRRIAHAEHAVSPVRTLRRLESNMPVAVERIVRQNMREMAFARPEFEHVAFMELFRRVDRNFPPARERNASHEDAAIVRPTVAHDVVAAFALEVCRSKSTGERLGKRLHLLFRRTNRRVGLSVSVHAVEHRAINRDDRMHVFGRLHAPFDLQRINPYSRKHSKQIYRAEVFGGKEMLARCLERFALMERTVVKLVGKAARLRAHAAIGGAAANHGRHEALSRIAHAKRAVGERLYFKARLMRTVRQMLDFGKAQLARKRHTLHAERRNRFDAGCAVRVHLS